jgi:Bacteriophage holin of superfamily 6 (Holin_LLH)
MNKVVMAILHFVKHSAVYVADSFVKIFGSDVAHNFVVAAESLIHTAIGGIAMVAVQEVESLASGADKRAAAFDKIKTGAEQAGIIVGESIINLLIEICVQKVKGNFGPA